MNGLRDIVAMVNGKVNNFVWGLPMLVLLAFTGVMISRGRRGMACVLTGLAFLALSPLVFGLLAGTALVMLADRGRQGVCLPTIWNILRRMSCDCCRQIRKKITQRC